MRTHRRHRGLSLKIKPIKELRKIVERLKINGNKIVFTNGCFDLIHYGHVQYLEDAKQKGDVLLVAINSDVSVKKIKGPGRPIVSQKDRARVIASLESVDYVTVFGHTTPLTLITLLKPDVLVKGADWNLKNIVGGAQVSKYGGRVCTIKLAKGRSTTSLIQKIAKTFKHIRNT